MMVEEFWKSYEVTINSYADLVSQIEEVFSRWGKKNKIFAWRGQTDASWPLHSSLYRRLLWSRGESFNEREMYQQEGKILTEVHRWGLHMSSTLGRLSVLNQLAMLQHYGAPTRLIDITFNPWIAAWFAVEPKWKDGSLMNDEKDSRLFAIDVTGRLINETTDLRPWEDDFKRPWDGDPKKPDEDARRTYLTWCTKVFAWRPSHFDGRIAAQNGGFLFGGVPISTGPKGPNQWPKEPSGAWKIDEVRAATSVSLRPHKFDAKRGAVGVAQDAVYTFRIAGGAKNDIRERLEKQFGYKHSTIYPDFTGFVQFGTPEIRNTAPEKTLP